MHKIAPIAIFTLFFFACQPAGQSESRNEVPTSEPEVIKDPNKIYNLMGEELSPLEISDEAREVSEINLGLAKANFDAKPDSLESIIWYGRRLAYLGKYLEAIGVFTEGLRIYPDSYHLYRHRGHRFITTRQLANAIEDFELAAYYSLNLANQIEPDGIPNRLNKPLSNDKFNIWYHFGLSYYLSGRFDKALSAYKKCMDFSDNDDLLVATSYWQYLTYMKLGNKELALEVLESISSDMKLIENDSYYELLKLYQSNNNVEKLLEKATNEGQIDPTMGYGLASYYQHSGNLDKANELFLLILESPNWNSFGYIAAEAELKTIFPVP